MKKKVVIELTIKIDEKDYVKGFASNMFNNLNEIGEVILNNISFQPVIVTGTKQIINKES